MVRTETIDHLRIIRHCWWTQAGYRWATWREQRDGTWRTRWGHAKSEADGWSQADQA